MRIAINGFGRTGRSTFRAALDKNANLVAINDVHGIDEAAYLAKYDTIYGTLKKKISKKGDNLIVGNKKIKILSERDPEKLPWKELRIDVVLECTGVFTGKKGAEKHLKAGAKKVLISAPSPDADVTIVPGMNEKKLKKSHKIISVGSCTTDCAIFLTKVLNDAFGIKNALITTVHAYTNTQALLDSGNKKSRKGRAAPMNIIPTTTGASKCVIEVLPELKGIIDAIALRVPVQDGSIVDLTAELKKSFTVKEVNAAFKKAAKKYKGFLEYSEEEIVSSDIIGNPNSAVFDSKLTQKSGNLVKIFGWYDNEYGYSARLIDMVKRFK